MALTYTFQMPGNTALRPVTVYNTAGEVQESGTLDSNAVFTVELEVGDYYARATSGRTTYEQAGTVDRGDEDAFGSGGGGGGGYEPPVGGIPKVDLATAVQTSLAKADSAVQTVNGAAPSSGNVEVTPLPGPLELVNTYFYGHSYLAAGGIAARITKRTGTTVTNRSTPGNTVAGTILDALEPGAKAWTSTKGVVVIDAVINRARQSNTTPFTTPQLTSEKESLRSLLRIFLNQSAALVTSGGTIVTVGFSGSFSGYSHSSSSGDSQTITPGSGVTKIGLVMGSSSNSNTVGFSYSTDGGSTYTEVPPTGPTIDTIAPLVTMITLPNNGSVIVKPYGGRTAFFKGYFPAMSTTPPSVVLVKDVPLNKTGMGNGAALSDANYATSLANLAALNGVVDTVAAEAEFGGIVAVANPAPGFDFAKDIGTDNGHPNAIGEYKYANAIQNAANTLALRNGMTDAPAGVGP